VLVWLKFILCSVALVYSGYRLCYLGDVISEKTKITKTIMGFAILAIATSMPEFVTSAASIVVVRSADLAAGDLFGTMVINLGIIALLDLIEGKGPIMLKAHTNHILYAGWTVILLAFISSSLLLRSSTGKIFTLAGVGVESFILILLFLIGLRIIFSLERTNQKDTVLPSQKLYQKVRLKSALVRFIFYIGAIFLLGIWLSRIGKEIVTFMGWSEALVGTFFLALVTSFPEFIVSISALRFDIDMAIGNILGSNFFDLMIVPLCDVLLRERAFLSEVRMENLFTIMLAIILSSIVIVGLICRSRRSFLKLGWDAIAIVVVLGGGGYVLTFLLR